MGGFFTPFPVPWMRLGAAPKAPDIVTRPGDIARLGVEPVVYTRTDNETPSGLQRVDNEANTYRRV